MTVSAKTVSAKTVCAKTIWAKSVWDHLVGQRPAIATLSKAVAGPGMTHAWLITGPPGSGRSNAAVAFAAALQCEQGTGCDECAACRTGLAGSHPDITRVATQKLSIGIDEVRDLVRRAALSPVGRGAQVFIIEDADRLTEPACNALLKAIEEPHPRTVWVLCAPTVEDVLSTIRSRCRLVVLSTPSTAEVARFLEQRMSVAPDLASYAARAAQGHIGRAKALAVDEATRNRRKEVVGLPVKLTSLGACMAAAAELVRVATEEAEALTTEFDAAEKVDLDASYGVVERGRRPREYAPALAALEKAQKARAKRFILDVVDRALTDLISVYRDAIAVGSGVGHGLVNEEERWSVEQLAQRATRESHLRRIAVILAAREQMLEFNVPALLALESMMVGLQLDSEGVAR